MEIDRMDVPWLIARENTDWCDLMNKVSQQ